MIRRVCLPILFLTPSSCLAYITKAIKTIVWLILFTCITGCARQLKIAHQDQGHFSFGVIADCQYCKIPGTGVRKYARSHTKLAACVAQFNTLDLTYTIHLGDFIDRDWESFDIVVPIYNQLVMPHLHVLGNHDYSVADDLKKRIPQKLDMPAKYYHFKVNNWRFIVLDGNDISFHAHTKGSSKYNHAAEYYERHALDSPKWNGAIGQRQMKWLDKVLARAEKSGEQVALFCHFPVFPNNVHNLWNAKEVIQLLEQYSVVKLYCNGHNHEGNYGYKNGIHYLTLKGMVDTEESAYAIISVFADRLDLKGFGRQENQTLSLIKN